MSLFQKAERRKAKLRLALVGPAGHGKTYSALKIAKGLGGKIAMIDTECGRGELYGNEFDYDIAKMSAPYYPEKYVKAITEAAAAGYEVIIIDSLSHAWAGEGGILEQQGRIADSGKANSFTAWRTLTPKHNQLIDTIISCPAHIIATMRAKTEYAVERESDRTVVRKLGLAPIQREGMDYEFTVVLDIGKDHSVSASKDSTKLFEDKVFTVTEDTGKALTQWLNEGV